MTTFMHAADLHIGLGVTRFEPDCANRIRGARIQALENVLGEASKWSVDFVLIAGDLFDDPRVDRTTVRRVFHILESSDVPVFILPGNHDPLHPGSVWDRPPWNQEETKSVRVLSRRKPTPAPGDVVLFPCPVLSRTSLEDPTSWVPRRMSDEEQGAIRVGVAHGSVNDRDNLPPDDHLIGVNVASEKELDYLALGHWHSMKLFTQEDGTCRMAYPGVHEPMSFPAAPLGGTGWLPYVRDPLRNDFTDEGRGQVLLVEIAEAGSPPSIHPLSVSHLAWLSDARSVGSGEDMGRLISEVARLASPERTLLKLRLEGVLDGQAMLRLDELSEVLRERYLCWELDLDALHLEPTEEEIRELVGRGVLRAVLERLLEETKGNQTAGETDEGARERKVAERAIMVLYRIAREVQK